MTDAIYSSYPPTLTPDQDAYLVQTVKDWSIHHGLSVRPNPAFISQDMDKKAVTATNAPVALFPTPFSKPCFEQAQHLQQTYNELYAAIANDETWLEEIMKDLIQVDDFIANLWSVHLAVKKEGYVQDLSLGLFRSDYMLHSPPDSSSPSLRQVEFNTISSSFGGLATLVSRMHTDLLTFPTSSTHLAYPFHPILHGEGNEKANTPPMNKAVVTLCNGLTAAHKAYGPSKSSPPLPLCIIFLVQPHERNLFDQLALSTYLHSNHQIPTFRLPANQILEQTSIPSSNPNRPLLYTPPSSPNSVHFEVTTIYFRALYSPTEYSDLTSWSARLHLERSCAIKCPTVLTHLVGSKKIQQVLTSKPPGPNHIQHLLPHLSPAAETNLRSTFAPQYSLSTEGSGASTSASEGLTLALDASSAEKHVLKPQREGGGNNIYKSAIPGFLRSLKSESEYSSYILMELIQPPRAAKNVVLRSDGEVVGGETVSELGIFGTCLWRRIENSKGKGEDGKGEGGLEILQNEEGGYLLRTKGRESDEGGVAAGFSSLDSVVLY